MITGRTTAPRVALRAYMHPTTAAALLALSRATTGRLRQRAELRRTLQRCGWHADAAAELADIHLDLQVAA